MRIVSLLLSHALSRFLPLKNRFPTGNALPAPSLLPLLSLSFWFSPCDPE